MTTLKELDIVEYTNDNGDKLKGQVVLIFTSLTGNRCVHINNFYLTRSIDQVKKINKN